MPLKDVDAAERAFRIKTLTWSAPTFLFGFLPTLIFSAGRDVPVTTAFMLAVGAGILTYLPFAFGGMFVIGRIAAVLERMTNPTGNLPPKRDYSFATSLMARGKYEEAAAAYEQAAAEAPADPEPRMLLARLYRDRLARHEEAASWFRQAIELPGLTPEAELLAARELIELYVRKLERPAKALPLLARAAERHAGTPHGRWAARELADLKERLRQAAEAEHNLL